MSEYKILFPIETTARELLYKLVLCGRFAELGYECYLGSKRQINELFSIVRPFLYFDKGYHQGVSERLYERIKENSGLIVSLDEEGGVDFKDSSTILARYPEELFSICDCVFLWGNHQWRILKEKRKNFTNGIVHISGHPRFELLKPAFQHLYKVDVDRLKDHYGTYLLVNTNMSFGNNIRGDQFVIANYGSRIKNIEQVIRYDKVKAEAFISFVKRFSKLSNIRVVVRPHPEEDISLYIKAFRGLRNANVVYQGSVIPWILASETMVHPDCTTGIESLMLGKRAISYLPPHQDMTFTYLPVELSYRFQEEDKLVNFLLNKGYNSSSTNSSDSLLNEYFNFMGSSIETILDRVTDLLSGKTTVESRGFSRRYSIRERVEEMAKTLYRILYLHTKAEYRLSANKMKGFDEASVRKIFQTLKPALFNIEVELERLRSQLFKISLQL